MARVDQTSPVFRYSCVVDTAWPVRSRSGICYSYVGAADVDEAGTVVLRMDFNSANKNRRDFR